MGVENGEGSVFFKGAGHQKFDHVLMNIWATETGLSEIFLLLF